MNARLMTFFKTNWLAIILSAVIIYLLTANSANFSSSPVTTMVSRGQPEMGVASSKMLDSAMPPIYQDPAPVEAENRLTVLDSSLSLLVNSVSESIKGVQTLAENSGGYLVNSNLSEPEGAATGSITVRVPVDQRDSVLDGIRQLGLRTVDEHTTGYDVTDQYTDIEAQLTTLRTTKTKFESLLSDATTVDQSLAVQRELINIQRQIDSYLGQQKYLEGNAKLSRITVSLATDELALPYAPDEPWRPQVVFRTAVRSLLTFARGLVSALIWVVTYAPLWLPTLGLYWWWSRRSTHTPR